MSQQVSAQSVRKLLFTHPLPCPSSSSFSSIHPISYCLPLHHTSSSLILHFTHCHSHFLCSSSSPSDFYSYSFLSSYLIQYCQFSFPKDKDTGPLTRIRLETVETLQDQMLPYLRPCQQLQTV